MQPPMRTLTARLAELPAAVRPTVRAAIAAVRAAAPPDAEEVAYDMAAPRSSRMMWKLVRYRLSGDNVLGVGTFTDHATIFFYRGRELEPGKAVLQGSGKDTRFVTLRSARDAKTADVARLIRRAFRLAAR